MAEAQVAVARGRCKELLAKRQVDEVANDASSLTIYT
jgi:hypothetical protein